MSTQGGYRLMADTPQVGYPLIAWHQQPSAQALVPLAMSLPVCLAGVCGRVS